MCCVSAHNRARLAVFGTARGYIVPRPFPQASTTSEGNLAVVKIFAYLDEPVDSPAAIVARSEPPLRLQ